MASGRNQEMPHGPSMSSRETAGDTDSNEGRKQHQAQVMKPRRMAIDTAFSEASFQKIAASRAGKNCAMAVKEISPHMMRLYAPRSQKTLQRDLEALRQMGLVEVGDDGRWCARTEIIEAFVPARRLP